ncbi:MAG: hypothetical protein BA863_12825 [Desulfovibrio sp. S3730MH75]|nr:MAG: hypothetical protein BA863_12825 [Desulfovibrio sp. S3730MH75]
MALILVVDDSSTMRKAITKVLKEGGHNTLEGADGRKGLEIAAIHAPDCILLDLIMPEVDGLGVLKTLREQGSKIPVIVLTADIQEIVRKECLELGATAFINKPMIGPELLKTIRKVLGLKEETSNEPYTRSD